MKIALFGNEFPSNYIKYINHLITKLESENVELIIHHKFHDFLQDSIDFSEETNPTSESESHGEDFVGENFDSNLE